VVSFTLFFVHFDQRFWVPNGSKKPGDYSSINLDGSEHKSFQLEQTPLKKAKTAETS
jgi:hypothetical protein